MIRKANPSDTTDLTRLSALLGYPISESLLLEQLTKIISDPKQILLVFENEAKVVGYILAETYDNLYMPGTYFNIKGLAVDEEMQGKGIARQLISEIEKIARERGFTGIRLNSGEHRLRAHQFYEKQGFSSTHLQKHFMKYFD